MHASDLLNDPDYLSKMTIATKLESFLNLELLTEAWNFTVFETCLMIWIGLFFARSILM